MAVLILEQHSGMSSMMAARLDGTGAGTQPAAYTSDGGVGSQVRLALLGAEHSIQYTITFKTREMRRASVAGISLSPLLEPGDIDRRLAEAEARYAQAEGIRRSGPPAEYAKSEALYDAAIAEAVNLRAAAGVAPTRMTASPMSLELRAWTGKARLLMYREENYLGAEQATLRAVHAGPDNETTSLPEKGELALAWKTYSSALALLNRYDEAVDASRHALNLYEQTGDEYWQGVIAGNLAFVYREIGQTEEAMAAAEQSLKLAESQKDDYGKAFALSAEGAISQGSGDYQAALDRYYQALEVVEALKKSIPHPQVEGEVWSNIGQTYADLGDWEQAESAYRHALPAVAAASDGVNEIEVAGRLAGAEAHSGKLEAAINDYQAALKRADEQGLLRQKTHLLTGLAHAEAAQAEAAPGPENQFTVARALFEQARTEARAIHQIDGEAEALSGLGDLLSSNGQRTEARTAYQRSVELWGEIPNDLEVARAQADLARLDRQAGQLDRACEEIFAALDQVERARNLLASESLRTSYFSSQHSFYELAVDVLMDLDTRTPGRGYAMQAWVVAERARARTLLDELASGAKTSPLDERQQALELRIREAEDRIAHLGTTHVDAAKAETAGQELHQLLLEADRAAQEARSHRLEGGVDTGMKPVSVVASMLASTPSELATSRETGVLRSEAQVTKALGGDTALYEYWTGVGRSYLWVIRPGPAGSGFSAYTLPGAAELQRRVTAYLGALLEREQEPAIGSEQELEQKLKGADRKASRLGEELGQLLFPAASLEGTREGLRRLVIVPDGPLEELPYAALQMPVTVREFRNHRAGAPAGSHTSVRARPYLVQRYELVEEPSAAALIELAETTPPQRSPRPEQVAVFADPVYSKTDPRLRPLTGPVAVALRSDLLRQAGNGIFLPQLPRLPGSKREALDIQAIAGAQHTVLFLDFDANPARLTETDWSQYRVLHVAAHAIANGEQPELSGIALSMVKQDGTAVNGMVRLHDVYRLHTPVELVVLSACGTLAGKNITGEGVEGMARAFLVAGSRSVLAMQWGANDASTSELMRTFYSRYLREGKSSAAALRAAQIRLIENPRHTAPYYWAGAVLEGNWRGQE